MPKWKDVYKKSTTINGKKALAVYFIPRYEHRMPFSHWIRLRIAEKIITPFLLTKEEYKEEKNNA